MFVIVEGLLDQRAEALQENKYGIKNAGNAGGVDTENIRSLYANHVGL